MCTRLILCLFVLGSACGDDAGPTTSTSDASASSSTTHATTSSGATSHDATSTSHDATSHDATSHDATSTSSDATSSDASGSATSSTTGDCQRITDDASAIGDGCTNDGDCPAGYTCFNAGGFVPQPLCRILCEQACECPDGLDCLEVQGKVNPPPNECRPLR